MDGKHTKLGEVVSQGHATVPAGGALAAAVATIETLAKRQHAKVFAVYTVAFFQLPDGQQAAMAIGSVPPNLSAESATRLDDVAVDALTTWAADRRR